MPLFLGWGTEYIKNAGISELDYQNFIQATEKILDDDRTWHTFLYSVTDNIPNYEKIKIIKFTEKNKNKCSRISGNNIIPGVCHMMIYFVNTNYVNTQGCPGLEEDLVSPPLSCTTIPHNGVYNIYINVDNCNDPYGFAMRSDKERCIIYSKRYPKYFMNNLHDRYLEYIINHEVGHALGRGHYVPKNLSSIEKNFKFPAPIMMQQTKGLYNYMCNTWPLLEEDGRCTKKTIHPSILREFNHHWA